MMTGAQCLIVPSSNAEGERPGSSKLIPLGLFSLKQRQALTHELSVFGLFLMLQKESDHGQNYGISLLEKTKEVKQFNFYWQLGSTVNHLFEIIVEPLLDYLQLWGTHL